MWLYWVIWYFLNLCEHVERIMKSLSEILKEDSNIYNFWSTLFTGNGFEKYTTAVTNIQYDKDDVNKEYINSGLNAIDNLISPQNNALKECYYLHVVARKTEDMLVW